MVKFYASCTQVVPDFVNFMVHKLFITRLSVIHTITTGRRQMSKILVYPKLSLEKTIATPPHSPTQNMGLRFWQFWTLEQKAQKPPTPRSWKNVAETMLYTIKLPSRRLFDEIPKTHEYGVQKVLGSKIVGTVHAFPECSQDCIYVWKRNIINISVSRNNKYQSECRKLVVVTFTQVLLWSDRWALRQLVRSTRNETTQNKRFPKEQNRQQISEEREQIVTHHHAKCKWNEMSTQATWRHFKNETSV